MAVILSVLSSAKSAVSEKLDKAKQKLGEIRDDIRDIGSEIWEAHGPKEKSSSHQVTSAEDVRKPSSAAQTKSARVVTREPSPVRKESVDGFDVIESDSGSVYGLGYGRPWERAKYLEEHEDLQPQTSKMEKVDIEIEEEVAAPVEPATKKEDPYAKEWDHFNSIGGLPPTYDALTEWQRASSELEEHERSAASLDKGQRSAIIATLNAKGFEIPENATFTQIADVFYNKNAVLTDLSNTFTTISNWINQRNVLLNLKMKHLHQYYAIWGSPRKDDIKYNVAAATPIEIGEEQVKAAEAVSKPAPRKLTLLTSSVSFHPGSFQRF